MHLTYRVSKVLDEIINFKIAFMSLLYSLYTQLLPVLSSTARNNFVSLSNSLKTIFLTYAQWYYFLLTFTSDNAHFCKSRAFMLNSHILIKKWFPLHFSLWLKNDSIVWCVLQMKNRLSACWSESLFGIVKCEERFKNLENLEKLQKCLHI